MKKSGPPPLSLEPLRQACAESLEQVRAASRQHEVDMRVGAYVLAVGRVAEATRLRGLFP